MRVKNFGLQIKKWKRAKSRTYMVDEGVPIVDEDQIRIKKRKKRIRLNRKIERRIRKNTLL